VATEVDAAVTEADAAEVETVVPEVAVEEEVEREESQEREIGHAMAAETTTSPGERSVTDARPNALMALVVLPVVVVIGAAVAVDSVVVVVATAVVDVDVAVTVVVAAVVPCVALPEVDAEGQLRIKWFIVYAGLKS